MLARRVPATALDGREVTAAFGEAAARGPGLLAVHAWRDVASEVPYQSVSPLVDWAGAG